MLVVILYTCPLSEAKSEKKSEEFLIGCSQAMASAANAHCKTVFSCHFDIVLGAILAAAVRMQYGTL